MAASLYFRDANKSVHVYSHENDATDISPSRPAAENATMTLRQDALPASPGQRLPPGGSSPSLARSKEKWKKYRSLSSRACRGIRALKNKNSHYIFLK